MSGGTNPCAPAGASLSCSGLARSLGRPRCAAYAADQDADSTAVGWAESYDSAAGARQSALSECRSRGGGSGCIVRVWGRNGPVVEEGLGLDRATRRQIQLGLQSAGFDPGGADGLFGPRTRSAIRNWQSSRGGRATGYLDGAAVEALRPAGGFGPALAAVAPPARPAAAAPQPASSTGAPSAAPAATVEQETVFGQSIANSTNPAEFETYLAQFPSGVFSALARARLAALQSPAGSSAAASGTRVGGAGSPASGSRVSGASAPAFGTAAGGDAPRRPGEVFRDCAECPEMVVDARRTGPAVESMYRFVLWLVPTVEKFPRRQKFLLGDRLQATALDVLERLVEATYTRDRRRRLIGDAFEASPSKAEGSGRSGRS